MVGLKKPGDAARVTKRCEEVRSAARETGGSLSRRPRTLLRFAPAAPDLVESSLQGLLEPGRNGGAIGVREVNRHSCPQPPSNPVVQQPFKAAGLFGDEADERVHQVGLIDRLVAEIGVRDLDSAGLQRLDFNEKSTDLPYHGRTPFLGGIKTSGKTFFPPSSSSRNEVQERGDARVRERGRWCYVIKPVVARATRVEDYQRGWITCATTRIRDVKDRSVTRHSKAKTLGFKIKRAGG